MPVTKLQAETCRTFFHATATNADGSSVRCRANGKCKTWKTRPLDFRLPVKHGLRECFYITPRNASEWSAYDMRELRRELKFVECAPDAFVLDAAMERGLIPS